MTSDGTGSDRLGARLGATEIQRGSRPNERPQAKRRPKADQARAALAVPKGLRGERRSADGVGCAAYAARIAFDEIENTTYEQPHKVRAGQAGGRAQPASMTPSERSAIAREAAAARWENRQ